MKKESIIPKANIKMIDNFINDQDVCEKSKEGYRNSINQFFNWVFESGYDSSKLTRVDILNFKKKLSNDKSPFTVDAYLTAVRKYFKWTSVNNIFPNISEGVRSPKKFKTISKMPLTFEQSTKLLDSVDRSTIKGLRDYAIINLMIMNGLRRIEVSRIIVGDIKDLYGKKVIYIQGKGRSTKDSHIYLQEETYAAIYEYLNAINVNDINEPVFKSLSPRNKGNSLTPHSISNIVKEHLIKINLIDKMYTAHSLRHTTACMLIDSGVDIYNIQLYLRHSSPTITQAYTRVMEEQKSKSNVCGNKMGELYGYLNKARKDKQNNAKTGFKSKGN